MNELLHKTIIKNIESITPNIKNCCTKGCSYCCYQIIEVYDFEKIVIQNAISNLSTNEKQQVKENLESWLDYFNSNTPNNKILDEFDTIKNFMNISKSNSHKCPLLIDDSCSIYKDRPLTCRIHSVVDSPEKCKINPHRSSSVEANHLRSYTIKFIQSFKKSELLFLPFIVAEVIKPNKKIKPLKKLYI